MTHVAGIDPGKNGGYAIYHLESLDLVEAGRLIFDNPGALYAALTELRVVEILIERAQGAPGQGNQFEYGRSFGRTEAVCMLVPNVKIYYCAASWWKGKLNVPVDKELARQKALRAIPNLGDFVKKMGDHGPAEAALIGRILLDAKLYAQLIDNNEIRLKPKKKKPVYRV
jgi:hypothetical protein